MRSNLLHPRIKDNSTDGFKQWPFTTVQFWAEQPAGIWKLHVDQIVNSSFETEFIRIYLERSLKDQRNGVNTEKHHNCALWNQNSAAARNITKTI
jgi:hypothetical protein